MGTSRTSVFTANPNSDDLQDGRHEDERQHLVVPPELQQLLHDDVPQDAHGAQASRREMRSDASAERDHGEEGQQRHLLDIGLEPGALQDDPAQHDEEVARGHQVRDGAQHGRHGADGEDEARQEHRGEQRRQQAELERDRLRVGDGGDQQAEAQRAQQIQQGGHEKIQVGAAHHHVEQHARGQEDDRRGQQRDHQVGRGLAQDQLGGAHGRHADLLHGAALLLAHHRHRGGEDRGQHQQEADQAGHQELGGAQLRVVEDARLVDRDVRRGRSRAGQRGVQEPRVGLGRDGPGVAEDGLRGAWRRSPSSRSCAAPVRPAARSSP